MFKASRSVRHGYLELFILAYVFILLTFICDESLMEIHICVARFAKKRGDSICEGTIVHGIIVIDHGLESRYFAPSIHKLLVN